MQRRYYIYLKDRPEAIKFLVNVGDGKNPPSPIEIVGRVVKLVSPEDGEVAKFNLDEWQGARWVAIE